MTVVTFSLVSHTNAGKTTLARTLLGQDIGEVRDAPHVTEAAAMYALVDSAAGDRLQLWDTPGFGDSARLVRRMRASGNPLGWFLSQVWDRWRDRPFWASQRALLHVQAESDLVLYLVNAAEAPVAAGYVESEMALLAWVGKPVLVLLNQLGPPRTAAAEAAEVEVWRAHLARWPLVRAVLPLDAFARCWVHELALFDAAQAALTGECAAALARLAAAWRAQREATFGAAMQVLAASLARSATARAALAEAPGWGDRLRQLGAAFVPVRAGDADSDRGPAADAQRQLAAALEAEVRACTAQLIALHGLQGRAEGEILSRVADAYALRERVPEGRAAVLGGAVSGALVGLKADIVSGGLTLGGGLLAGGLLGALGAAGLARGINVVRGTGRSWVAWSDAALQAAAEAALLRYLAVAHFGRGRGDWSQGEAPAHWAQTVARALAPWRDDLAAAFERRGRRWEEAPDAEPIAAALRPPLEAAARAALHELYPETAVAARGGATPVA